MNKNFLVLCPYGFAIDGFVDQTDDVQALTRFTPARPYLNEFITRSQCFPHICVISSIEFYTLSSSFVFLVRRRDAQPGWVDPGVFHMEGKNRSCVNFNHRQATLAIHTGNRHSIHLNRGQTPRLSNRFHLSSSGTRFPACHRGSHKHQSGIHVSDCLSQLS